MSAGFDIASAPVADRNHQTPGKQAALSGLGADQAFALRVIRMVKARKAAKPTALAGPALTQYRRRRDLLRLGCVESTKAQLRWPAHCAFG